MCSVLASLVRHKNKPEFEPIFCLVFLKVSLQNLGSSLMENTVRIHVFLQILCVEMMLKPSGSFAVFNFNLSQ